MYRTILPAYPPRTGSSSPVNNHSSESPSSDTSSTDDWLHVSDPAQRRRIQNRNAQRKHRKAKRRLKSMPASLAKHRTSSDRMPRHARSGWRERRQPSNSALRDFSDSFRESGWCHDYRVVSTEPSSTFLQPESSWLPFTESPEFGPADGPYAYEDPQKLRTHDELWAFPLIQDLPQGLVSARSQLSPCITPGPGPTSLDITYPSIDAESSVINSTLMSSLGLYPMLRDGAELGTLDTHQPVSEVAYGWGSWIGRRT